MQLIIFDLDGTLTQTSAIDSRCYELAVRTVTGIQRIDTDWSTYVHTTDEAIARELIKNYFSRPARESEIKAIKRCFKELLDIAADQEPHQFQPVPGAAELLAHISATTNYRAIIATGAWRDSADIKISCAGLDAGSLPVVTSDAAPTRERLLAGALSLATDRYDVSGFDRIVSVGDAIWDV